MLFRSAASLKDRAFAEDALAKGRAILDRALPLADRIFGEIEASLL